MGTGLALLGIKTLERMGAPDELLMGCQSKKWHNRECGLRDSLLKLGE